MHELICNRKKQIAKIGKYIVIIIVLLTFFSKTIANMMLPSVRVCIPKKKDLSKKVTCEGETLFKKVIPVYSPVRTQVLEVYVKEGDRIKEGQPICRIDTIELNNQIEAKKIEAEKNRLNIEGLERKLADIRSQIEKEKGKIKEKQLNHKTSSEKYNLAIENKKKAVEVNEMLYEQGLISERELIESQIELADLEKEKSDEINNEKKEKQEAAESAENKMQTLEIERDTVQRELALTRLELKSLELNLTQLTERAGDIIVADRAGIVMEKAQGEGIIQQGELVNENQALIKIGILEEGFRVKVIVEPVVNFIKIGDSADLKIGDKKGIKGLIESIRRKKDTQDIYISVEDIEIEPNQLAKVTLQEDGIIYDNVIPADALYEADNSYYVYVAEKVDDALGNAYRIKKVNVYVEDYNEKFAAIEKGVNVLNWVVTASEKPIKEGLRVKVENENEVLSNE